MLVEYYADALIADEIWTLWDAGLISDDQAALAWLLVALQAAPRLG